MNKRVIIPCTEEDKIRWTRALDKTIYTSLGEMARILFDESCRQIEDADPEPGGLFFFIVGEEAEEQGAEDAS